MDILVMLIAFIPVIAILACTPYVTRKTESFGISIPEDVYFSNPLKEMRKKYAWQSTGLGVILILIWLIISSFTELTESTTYTYLVPGFIIGSFLIYLRYHKLMKAMKDEENWHKQKQQKLAVDLEFRSRDVGISMYWYLIPIGFSVITLLLTLVFYSQMPAKWPMQYDFSGNVTNWGTKSLKTALFNPILQIYMTGLFLFINKRVIESKQQLDSAKPEESLLRNQIFRQRWSVFNFLTGTLMVFLFGISQLSHFNLIHKYVLMTLVLIIVGVLIIGAIVLAFTTGQGGSRIKLGESKQTAVINRDEDDHWKLGIFYYNPDDPAVWIDKRFGIGWTINFARPIGWISIIVILVPLILISAFF